MCGIAGSYAIEGSGVPDDRMSVALSGLAHRGPDDQGVYRSGRVVLGHRRLSVIDTTEAGHQPFQDQSGRYTMVFNGEVFNFQELREELRSQGHSFRSRTDTEVVLRLYALKGPEFLHDLNGFFALAIHDAEKDELFLARDRFGIKPLLWCATGGHVHFGSELRCLLALGADVRKDLDSEWIYFRHHYIPAPSTILKDIYKLEPGHAMVVSGKGAAPYRWYDLDRAVQLRTGTEKAPSKELVELLDDAVRLRLISDVPIGTFLSGGLDSSIVSSLAVRHKKDLRTFSIGYRDDPYFDETEHAEAVARHIGSDHTTFSLGREELAETYIDLLDALDEPFADSSALPSFILCRKTRQHVTVALSGDGADEVFGGYRKHQAALLMDEPGVREKVVMALAPLWRSLPRSRDSKWSERARQLDRFATAASLPERDRYLELASFEDRKVVQELTGRSAPEKGWEAMTKAFDKVGGPATWLRNDLDLVLPNDMLHKVDLTSMAHGLEVRTPFLDRRVVEFAFDLPLNAKLRRGNGKAILREAFQYLLPPHIVARSKKGFEVPLRELFLGPLSTTLDRILTRELVMEAGLSWPAVQAVRKRSASSDPGASQATVHALLVYLMWWKRHGIRTP